MIKKMKIKSQTVTIATETDIGPREFPIIARANALTHEYYPM